MMTRNYKHYSVKNAAALIVSEVISEGKSEGWQSWDREHFNAIEEICNKYNVHYVDDFNGTWEYRAPRAK